MKAALRRVKGSCAVAAVVGLAFACSGAPSERSQRLKEAREDLSAQVEAGLVDYLPPPLSYEERELFDIRTARTRAASEMSARAKAALAPLAIAAAMFAPQGPAELLLGVVPVGKLTKGAKQLLSSGLKTRKQSKKSKQLIATMDRLQGELEADDWQFLWVAARLTQKRRAALATINKHAGSGSLLRALVHKTAKGKDEVDLQWIAAKLESGAFDGKTARRFTFDADFADQFTRYRANPSWRVLQRVVDGASVTDKERTALAIKMAGLMGEQAAAQMVTTPAFARKILGRDGAFTLDRGVGYGGNKSLDIAAYSDDGKAVFAEVKNWSADTWRDRSKQRKVLDQLARHNLGVTNILDDASKPRELKAKLLIVKKEPFLDELEDDRRERFVAAVKKLGWEMEYVPSADIPGFGEVIDGLRR